MEEYPISDDIALLNDKAIAAEKMVGLAMRLPFGYRKALRASTDAIKFNRIFWKRIREVYASEFDGKTIAYNNEKQVVYIPDNKSLETDHQSHAALV